MTNRILFVDNDVDFMETRCEYLKQAGYEIIQARSLTEAEEHLDHFHIHLMIIDIRLKDDDDDQDISGLALAKNLSYRVIPKIILTGFTSLGYVREVMRPHQTGLPAAIDFIAKQDGPETLILAVKRAFDEIILTNKEQNIDWQSHNPFSLVSIVDPEIKGKRLPGRADEFVELFHQILSRKDHLRIDRILWHRNGRAALVVLAFQGNSKVESYLVTCGQNSIITEEFNRFQVFAPKAQGHNATIFLQKVETLHYAACVYALTNNILDSFQTLKELYLIGPERIFNAAITSLLRDTVLDWHADKPIYLAQIDPRNLSNLPCYPSSFSQTQLKNCLQFLERQASTLGVQIGQSSKGFFMRYGEKVYSLSDPILALSHLSYQKILALPLINVPGVLSGENVLVDSQGNTWLTDFADAGQAPLLWNYAATEAMIRFDWVETIDILRLHEFEESLIRGEFGKPDLRDLEPVMRKPARAIQLVRKSAARTMGSQESTYHTCILLHAFNQLAQFDLQSPITSHQLARMIHIFLSISLISEQLTSMEERPDEARKDAYPELSIDSSTHTVLIGNQKKKLAPRPFKLLEYLYTNSSRVCSMDELREKVVGQNYNATYIHTLVGRIRDVIEEDLEHAHYLISEPHVGYRLVLHPKSSFREST